MTGGGIHDLAVRRYGLVGDRLLRVALACATKTPLAKLGAQHRVVAEPAQAVGKRGGVPHFEDQASVADDMRDLPTVRSHHVDAACHRLDEHAAELLFPAFDL